jgi:hypothetical protein
MMRLLCVISPASSRPLLKHFNDTKRRKFPLECIVNNVTYFLQDMKVKKEVLGLSNASDLCVKF